METAARYGIDADRAVNYHADKEGTRVVYQSVANAVCSVRENKELKADWSEEIDRDYQNRGRS